MTEQLNPPGMDKLFDVPPTQYASPDFDPRSVPPAGFPPTLEGHLEHVVRVLSSVAEQHNSRLVTTLAVGHVMLAHPYKRHVEAAHSMAAWACGGGRRIKDVTATYRAWLAKCDDYAGREALPGSELAVAPGGNVTPMRPRRADKPEQVEVLRGMRRRLNGGLDA